MGPQAVGVPRWFKRAENAEEARKVREFRTVDIVRRCGVISPNRVHLKNYPMDNPLAVFNPAMLVEGEHLKIYARIILGYFMYLSGIALLEVPLDDVERGAVSISHYPAELVLYPSTRYDIWGTEDPRVSRVDGVKVMVYTGRTINYFNPAVRRYRTAPVAAVDRGHEEWQKVAAFVLSGEARDHVISDKDAFLVRASDGTLLLFHRPHMDDEQHYLVVSRVPEDVVRAPPSREVRVVEVVDTTLVLEPAEFEVKLGWAAPPIEVERDTYLALIHGVDREVEGYRVLAALLKYEAGRGVRVVAVTPYYIMEPRTPYEVFGDRPFTVFPCGACLVDDKILVSYGAADYMVGIGEIDLSELMSHLDEGRLE